MTISWALTSCLLIAVVLLLRFALGRKISARLRYALWLVVLVRLLIPAQLITVPAAAFPSASWEEVSIAYPVSGGTPVLNFENHEVTGAGELPAASPSSNGTSGEAGSAGAFPSTAALPQILLGIWATGSCAVLLAILFSNLRFARCLRRVRQPMENVENRLPVYVADGLPSPCLFGLFRPAIYLTEDAVKDEAVLRHVLVHEETHFRHGDHIWSALRGVALALHWWNPLVWLTVVLSRQDGELACDEGALKRLGEGERTAYGETLLKLVTAKPGPRDLLRCATTMTGGKRSLRERIGRIACKRKNLVSLSVAALILAVLCCTVVFSRPVEESVGEGDGESWRTAEITVDDSGVPYRRNAGEETWTRLGGPIAPPAEWAAQDLGGRNQATALEWVSNGELHAQYVSASDAWLVVTYGRGVAAADTYVYRSEDGGVTWREMTKPPTSWHLSSVGFISPDCLIVASRLFDGAPVFITRDGGENWEEIPLPEGAYQAEAVAYDGEAITIAVSASVSFAEWDPGWTIRSSDLGETWITEKVSAPTVVELPEYPDSSKENAESPRSLSESLLAIQPENVTRCDPPINVTSDSLINALHHAAGNAVLLEEPAEVGNISWWVSMEYTLEGAGEQSIVLHAGLTEDLVKISLFGQNEMDAFVEDAALYRLVRQAWDTPEQITEELDGLLYDAVIGQMEERLTAYQASEPQARYTGYELTQFYPLITLDDILPAGELILYQHKYVMTLDHPEEANFYGGMYLDSQLRMDGLSIAPLCAVRENGVVTDCWYLPLDFWAEDETWMEEYGKLYLRRVLADPSLRDSTVSELYYPSG